MRVITKILDKQATITPRCLSGLPALSEIHRIFETIKHLPHVEHIVFDLCHIEEIDFSATHLLQLLHEKSRAHTKCLLLINCKRPIRQMLNLSIPQCQGALNIR